MINVIYAESANGVVGVNNSLPWAKMVADMRRFHNLTVNNTVVMGRKTFESLPRKLKNRRNIVLSTTLDNHDYKGVTIVRSMEEVFEIYKKSQEDFYFIGGENIWKGVFGAGCVDNVYRTIIHKDFDGDTYAPTIPDSFSRIIEKQHKADKDNPYDYTFEVWVS